MALAPSSPRLPSPPPAAEIQMTPNSPSGGSAATLEATQMEQSLLDANSKRRIHPGTKASDMAAGPPLVPLSELESAFSLQEHLAALHYNLTAQGTRALARTTAHQIAQPPAGIDRTLWLYELCRFLISQCNTLISKNVGLKNLVNVFRRLHRIFAHAWFQHRSVFWAIEGQSGLYVFFKTVCDLYDLLPAENYKLPPEAEGLEAPEAEHEPAANKSPTATAPLRPYSRILKPSSPPQNNTSGATSPDDNLQPHGRTTTRRHIRSSPSTGSAVMTVMETDEEETDAVTRGLDGMHLAVLSSPNLSRFADEPEVAEVPAVTNEALANEPVTQSTKTNEVDDKAEEADTTGAEGISDKPEAESVVADNSAKVTESAAKGPSTTPAVLDATVSPGPGPSIEMELAKESADTIPADQDESVTGHPGVETPAGQDTEANAEAVDSSSGGVAGTDTTESSSTTAAEPSTTTVEEVKEDDQKDSH
ncbi:hypothetical protein V2A60_007564 [Cordyceps javanica]|uniref:Mob1 family protein n=1 Tax=Cordyceps javanica TaxID=43265 RepID=A0A545W7H0_9HYPO|nr:Mob1 family protein [Cordyceps javanica]TQW09941.1 Mob1 family protein [Cordyceps javanica]